MTLPTNSPIVLFIHGAQHTPAHCKPLQDALAARNITTIVPRMPSTASSLTDDPATLGDLEADTSTIHTSLAPYPTNPIMIIAHSFGGLAAIQASSLPNIKHIIFLSAGIPKKGLSIGETMQSLSTSLPEGASEFDFTNLTAKVKSVDLTIDTLFDPESRNDPRVRHFVETMMPVSLKSYSQVAHIPRR
ncbi:hypothetical protein HK097_000100 [Rhizophlyctis rosea]|uniref:AB hydrolase-1 domain-containing protein n=1 Tax=Rhizophlyctis rosea TaxID=64517 RepID=A0AAD5X2U7_9FUNG|nr:hypothetical protein HK097_000100 [Rhizophlyctis rosea]